MALSAPPPTDEQLAAIDMACRGDSFKVVAYAGAGKTTTLKLISQNLGGRGLYLAFNKAIAVDAQGKFPAHVRCQTFHSLAFRHVARDITAKVSLPRLTPSRMAEELGLSPVSVTRNLEGVKKPLTLSKAKLGMIIGDSLSNFCKTASEYPAPRHLVLPEWLDPKEDHDLRNYLYPALEARWHQAIDSRHQGGIGHDIYLKLWTLSNPRIPADFILFDEAQDADPLMMGVLIKQDVQTVYVGDAHQQIYEWRGAVNAMKRLPCDETLLTQSFRFGEAVADVANVLLKCLQETVPLRGNPHQHSVVHRDLRMSQKDAILCRTNAGAIVRLLTGLKSGHRVALQADSQRILRFCQGAESLKNGRSAYGIPELAYFSHWQEVKEFAETSDGSDIKTWVRLIEDHGTATITSAMNALSVPQGADYVVSTAHKAKGLEWARVQVADDFIYSITDNIAKVSPAELRLLYVACTRAKTQLDVHGINTLLTALTNNKFVYD